MCQTPAYCSLVVSLVCLNTSHQVHHRTLRHLSRPFLGPDHRLASAAVYARRESNLFWTTLISVLILPSCPFLFSYFCSFGHQLLTCLVYDIFQIFDEMAFAELKINCNFLVW